MKVKWGLITLSVLLVAWGIFALAAEYGTQSDPLVSLSYITGVLRPELLKQAETESKSRAEEVQATVDRFDEQVNAKISEFTDRNTAQVDDSMIGEIAEKVKKQIPQQTANAPFTTVTLAAGKTLVLSEGCEVLLRSGSVTCSASQSPALIDMTTGGAVTSGDALSANHLYLVPGSGRSVRAGNAATVLVRGQYSLS